MPAMSDPTAPSDPTGTPAASPPPQLAGPLRAEIIAVGTELTSGAKLDTNSQWISRELADRGVPVAFHTTVADDLQENIAAVKTAVQRAGLVLLTGGLGPTRDDLTREMLAQAAGVLLERDEAAVAMLETFFEARGRTMPERNLLQAMVPRGGQLLENPVGTAPGVWLTIPRAAAGATTESPRSAVSHVVAMPGVPSEMKPMFLSHVVPRLPAGGTIARRVINCYGIGESAAEELLGELTDRGRDPEVGITASAATISLRVLAHGRDVAEAEAKAEEAERVVCERLQRYIFGRDADDVEHALVRELTARSLSVASIEVGTAGELARRLFAAAAPLPLPTQDATLAGSIIATPNDRLLPPAGSEPFGEARAIAMAEQLRERTQAAAALAILADPAIVTAVPTPDHAAGYLAVATADGTETEVLTLLGNPAIHAARLAKSAMNRLRLKLLSG